MSIFSASLLTLCVVAGWLFLGLRGVARADRWPQQIVAFAIGTLFLIIVWSQT